MLLGHRHTNPICDTTHGTLALWGHKKTVCLLDEFVVLLLKLQLPLARISIMADCSANLAFRAFSLVCDSLLI